MIFLLLLVFGKAQEIEEESEMTLFTDATRRILRRNLGNRSWYKFSGMEPQGCYKSIDLGHPTTEADAKARFERDRRCTDGMYLMFNKKHPYWNASCCTSTGRKLVKSTWVTYRPTTARAEKGHNIDMFPDYTGIMYGRHVFTGDITAFGFSGVFDDKPTDILWFAREEPYVKVVRTTREGKVVEERYNTHQQFPTNRQEARIKWHKNLPEITSTYNHDYKIKNIVDAPERKKNQVVKNAGRYHHIGGYGGKCRCPNGQEYWVGDNYDHCRSLACVGGASGTCNRYWSIWSYKGVICGN